MAGKWFGTVVDWAAVAAFIGPLVAAMCGIAGLYAYMSKQREKRVNQQIVDVTGKLEANQTLLQQRIDQVESAIAANSRQLERQNDTILTAIQSIARIEGRLSGSIPPSGPPT